MVLSPSQAYGGQIMRASKRYVSEVAMFFKHDRGRHQTKAAPFITAPKPHSLLRSHIDRPEMALILCQCILDGLEHPVSVAGHPAVHIHVVRIVIAQDI